VLNFKLHAAESDLSNRSQLKIFVSEKLEAYQKFYESHREFVTGTLGLKHESNLVWQSVASKWYIFIPKNP
jgi:hypothetical protein